MKKKNKERERGNFNQIVEVGTSNGSYINIHLLSLQDQEKLFSNLLRKLQ